MTVCNNRETRSARKELNGPRLPKTWRRRCLQRLSPSARMDSRTKNYSCSLFASLQTKAVDSCPGGAQLDPDVSLAVCVLIFTPSLRNAISHFCMQFPLRKKGKYITRAHRQKQRQPNTERKSAQPPNCRSVISCPDLVGLAEVPLPEVKLAGSSGRGDSQ